jgi:hypothetical protein
VYIRITMYIYLIHPDAYVSKVITDMGAAVAQPFNRYLSSNPELSHTTTDYLTNVYNDLLPKYKEMETTVGGGPLVKGEYVKAWYSHVRIYIYMHMYI